VPDAVIVATARSPIGRANKGSLASLRADDLAAQVVRDLMSKVPALSAGDIDDLVLGTARPWGTRGNNAARVVALLAGLDIPGFTLNRYCASSLQSISVAAHAIRAGEGQAFIAAGVESVSDTMREPDVTVPNPRFDAAQARSAARARGGQGEWHPADGLADVYIAMGQTAENVGELEGVSREEMDQFALLSQQRAVAHQANGFFADEITPIVLADGSTVTTDDGPRADTSLEQLAALRPVFRDGGAVTAGNSCPLNDGAAAVLVMSSERARQLGIEPLARVVSTAVTSLDPEIMGLGPIEASRVALQRAGLGIDDIDLVEINEAFAAQVIPSARHLGIGWDKLNVRGGAIALGHPFGQTGARIMTTLLHSLRVADGRWGLETMCVGGGQGMAVVVERIA
jgi:acetyl-CoA C-acetyltransferase